jgi:hypothetical protein
MTGRLGSGRPGRRELGLSAGRPCLINVVGRFASVRCLAVILRRPPPPEPAPADPARDPAGAAAGPTISRPRGGGWVWGRLGRLISAGGAVTAGGGDLGPHSVPALPGGPGAGARAGRALAGANDERVVRPSLRPRSWAGSTPTSGPSTLSCPTLTA